MVLNLLGFWGMTFFNNSNRHFSSSDPALEGSGNSPFFSYWVSHLTPSNKSIVASPPSSTKTLGPLPSGHVKAYKVHSQYSAKVSPFQAKTLEVWALTIAAAALS